MYSTSLSSNLGVMVDDGNIRVDDNMRTNLKKVYAIGDIVKGKRQISKAVYDGMTAGYSIIEELKQDK